MSDFVTVARTWDVEPGEAIVVEIDGVRIGIAQVEGAYYAFGDVCTHDDGPVAEGKLEEYLIECPRHGALFDIRSGAVKKFPAVTPIPVYELRVVGDEIQVDLEPKK